MKRSEIIIRDPFILPIPENRCYYLYGTTDREWCMPSEPHGEGDIAVELWKKLEPGEVCARRAPW